MERSRKIRFTLAHVLTFITAVPVCMGVVVAVESAASNQSYEWFGIEWRSNVRHFLIDSVGLPMNFVTGYVSFAMIDLPAWICYSVIALTLGLIRSKWAMMIGVTFIMSVFAWDLASDYFSGLGGQINTRLVSMFGVAVPALSFALARVVRGHTDVPKRKTGRVAIGFTCLAIVISLATSIYGWWIVGQNR